MGNHCGWSSALCVVDWSVWGHWDGWSAVGRSLHAPPRRRGLRRRRFVWSEANSWRLERRRRSLQLQHRGYAQGRRNTVCVVSNVYKDVFSCSSLLAVMVANSPVAKYGMGVKCGSWEDVPQQGAGGKAPLLGAWGQSPRKPKYWCNLHEVNSILWMPNVKFIT